MLVKASTDILFFLQKKFPRGEGGGQDNKEKTLLVGPASKRMSRVQNSLFIFGHAAITFEATKRQETHSIAGRAVLCRLCPVGPFWRVPVRRTHTTPLLS